MLWLYSRQINVSVKNRPWR